MKKPTIAGLQREKEELEKKVEHLDGIITRQERDDEQLRITFARMLESYAPVRPVQYELVHRNAFGDMVSDRTEQSKMPVPNWHEIAVLIGELKADANYAMILEARDNFRRESDQKSELIQRMRRTMMAAGVEFDFRGEERL